MGDIVGESGASNAHYNWLATNQGMAWSRQQELEKARQPPAAAPVASVPVVSCSGWGCGSASVAPVSTGAKKGGRYNKKSLVARKTKQRRSKSKYTKKHYRRF